MAKNTTVTIGGREYTLNEKLHKQASARWREKLRTSSTVLMFSTLDQIGDAIAALRDGGVSNLDVGIAEGLTRILPSIANALLNCIDEVWELVYAYSSDIAADREYHDEHAYDDEAITAFGEILKLSFPIMALLGLVSGRKAPGTAQNSPTANGATGLSPLGPKRKIAKTS
jgi:hypothetical protein